MIIDPFRDTNNNPVLAHLVSSRGTPATAAVTTTRGRVISATYTALPSTSPSEVITNWAALAPFQPPAAPTFSGVTAGGVGVSNTFTALTAQLGFDANWPVLVGGLVFTMRTSDNNQPVTTCNVQCTGANVHGQDVSNNARLEFDAGSFTSGQSVNVVMLFGTLWNGERVFSTGSLRRDLTAGAGVLGVPQTLVASVTNVVDGLSVSISLLTLVGPAWMNAIIRQRNNLTGALINAVGRQASGMTGAITPGLRTPVCRA